MMCYSDFPAPETFPNFMHNSQVWEYLRLYAQHFDLEKHIEYHTRVISIARETDEGGVKATGRWQIQLQNTQTQRTWSDTFDG